VRGSCFEGLHDPLGHFASLDGIDELLYLGVGQQHSRVLLDEAGIAGGSNIVWHRGLEFTFSPEHHQRDQLGFVYAKKRLKRFGMAIILVKRILKPVFLAEQTLCPLRALHIPKYPAGHVLGLDDEDAVLRDDDVVDLGRAMLGLQRNVVQRDIDFGVEQQLLSNSSYGFANPTLDE